MIDREKILKILDTNLWGEAPRHIKEKIADEILSSQWISVEEYTGGIVLAYFPGIAKRLNNEQLGIRRAYLDSKGYWRTDQGVIYLEPTCFQPLPAPPEDYRK